MSYNFYQTDTHKYCRSEVYNYNFDKKTGFFARWGRTESEQDDPVCAPAPEILDIEVTTKCSGPTGFPCRFCYKSNTPSGHNMSLDEFKNIIDKMPWLTQIALGADATLESNPAIFDMMQYARDKGIIPNITVANISDETADKLVKLVGAVAISRYNNKKWCYDSVKRLTDRGLTQVNIHQLVSFETYEDGSIFETLLDRKIDHRLQKLNAIVFLSLKQQGRGINHSVLSKDKFSNIVRSAINNKVNFGFDSCSAHKLINALSIEELDKYKNLIEPCESTCFSSYINAYGKFFPCSFVENTNGWKEGLDALNTEDFIKDIWYNEKTVEFRKKLLNNNRKCPAFNVGD